MGARPVRGLGMIAYALLALSSCASHDLPGPVPLAATASPPGSTRPTAIIRDDNDALVQPADFVYAGAFRLPESGERPLTFEYGGNGLTCNPGGDPAGADDGFPGSLFITGHDRLPYGEMPDGSQVAEITIPAPITAGSPEALSRAELLQGLENVTVGFFKDLDEIPRIGIAYLDAPATGPKIHIAWGQHLQPDAPAASHGWFSPDLARADTQGTWFIGSQSLDSVNGYLFDIPAAWADAHTAGRPLATGRYRDGGWSGMGPALFAYRPWVDDRGTPARDGVQLQETVLLLYESSRNSDKIERAINGYQHADEWEGGAWVTTKDGRSAVLFAGTKATGAKYWYGYVNPVGPDKPCVDGDLVGEFDVCRLADSSPCTVGDLVECAGHGDYRGWWSSRFDAQLILYDPGDLARVAAGEMGPWEPQPFAVLDIDEHLFLNPANVETEMLGTGDQRRFRIGAAAFDPVHHLLYLVELFADGASAVIHVWRVG